MKQIFTFLISLGTFATSFAQYSPDHRDDRYAYNDHFNGKFSPGDKDFQIQKINREFDFKIQAIQNNWSLRRHQKKVAVRELERERLRQIQIVNARFRDWKRGHHRDGYHWDNM
jgi:hypothetical protein